jgi:hypothetical protein
MFLGSVSLDFWPQVTPLIDYWFEYWFHIIDYVAVYFRDSSQVLARFRSSTSEVTKMFGATSVWLHQVDSMSLQTHSLAIVSLGAKTVRKLESKLRTTVLETHCDFPHQEMREKHRSHQLSKSNLILLCRGAFFNVTNSSVIGIFVCGEYINFLNSFQNTSRQSRRIEI